MECHSYHSFYFKYFSRNCHKDEGLNEVLRNNIKPLTQYHYDTIIIDEIQDCSELFYKAVLYMISYLHRAPKLILLGDSRQSIYDYKGSSSMYLEQAREIFSLDNQFSFRELNLKVSFRVTKQIAGFINECLVGKEVLKSNKEGPKVRYICDNIYQKAIEELNYYIYDLKIKYDEIFVLAPSLRSRKISNPVNRLENQLTKQGIPIFVPSNDEEVNECELKGKVAFLSFHQSKGLEREVTIVFSFDKSYFRYYNSNRIKKDVLPNPFYVALTRSRKHLTVFQSNNQEAFAFTNIDMLKSCKWCDFQGEQDLTVKSKKRKEKVDKLVSDILRHVPENLISKLIRKLQIIVLREAKASELIQLKKHINTSSLTIESVAEITGLAVPAFFELKTTRRLTLFQEIRAMILEAITSREISDPKAILMKSANNLLDYNFFFHIFDTGDMSCIMDRISNEKNCDYLLIIATVYNGITNGFAHKNNQIQVYDWLTKNELERMADRLEKNLPKEKNMEFEYKMRVVFPKTVSYNIKTYDILGSADIILNEAKEIWELKCCSELTNIHILQLAVYMNLFNKMNGKNFKGKLFNITTNQLIEVRALPGDLEEITLELLKYNCRGGDEEGMEDEELVKTVEFVLKSNAIKDSFSLPKY